MKSVSVIMKAFKKALSWRHEERGNESSNIKMKKITASTTHDDD